MRELIVVRHGESEGNVRGIAQGELPFPLTDRGRGQARLAARLMHRLAWGPDRVVSSPTVRCRETAGLIAAELALPEPSVDPAFTEIDCGNGTGLTFEELRLRHPDFFDLPPSEWRGFQQIGGESDDALVVRVGEGLDRIDRLDPEARVVLVTHGAVFRGVLAHLLGFTSQYFLELRNGTCLRLARTRVGAHETLSLTHLVHAGECG